MGIACASFGLGAFLLPNSFIDGGIVGISLLIAETSHVSLAALIAVLNLPFVYMGYRMIGTSFAVKTCISILALSAALAFIPFPSVTNDKLLVAVFGGIFLGLGIGFTMRGGGVLDGSEVLAVALSKRFGLTVGDFILGLNILIFSVAALILTVETALYAGLTYFSTSRMVDFVVEGVEEFVGVTIISPKVNDVRLMIVNTMGSGVTMYSARGGYHSVTSSQNITEALFTVITRLELNKLYAALDTIDPEAFVTITSIKDTRGGRVRRRTG